tara:strand:- start:596 stop:793 length:198 start_codon:yes stop_codon:yes gene_type:complete
MRNKLSRRNLHLSQLRTTRTNNPKSRGANKEEVITSRKTDGSKQIHKKITINSQSYFVEMKTTKD